MTTSDSPAAAPDITVVVITFNRAPMLAQTLASLTKLNTDPGRGEPIMYEVVVVDNASTDNTQEVIAGFLDPSAWGAAQAIRSVYETTTGVAPARNRGMAESNATWIAFHDDDQQAHPDWLAKLVELARRRNLKVAGGAVHLMLPEGNTRKLSKQCRVLLGERVGWDEEQPYTRKRIPGTNNLLIHKSVIDGVGDFDTMLKVGGSDADLYRRIRTAGYEAWYTPKSIVYHMIPEKRLGDDYMRWTATRHGMHLALREYREWGPARLAVMIVLRTGQAAGNYLPRFLLARVAGQRERALGARALLWRSQAYLSRACQLLWSGDTNEASQGASLQFRQGREQLIRGATESTTSGG